MATDKNPFSITKSNDLGDDEIEGYWVSIGDAQDAFDLVKPKAMSAHYILGGKGSGKSHLMRYHSLKVKIIRYKRENLRIADGILKDGFVGLYASCSGMEQIRFGGKSVGDEIWGPLFKYYYELWVADVTLDALCVCRNENLIDAACEQKIVKKILELFDRTPGPATSLEELRELLSQLRKDIDYEVNNAATTKSVNVKILLSPNRLFFGIPEKVVANVPTLSKLKFVYLLDELENFPAERQIFINDLVRERKGPSTFRIGSRLYGRRTTISSGGEKNIEGAEFHDVYLDERFRNNEKEYRRFAFRMIHRRLDLYGSHDPQNQHLDEATENLLQGSFESLDVSIFSPKLKEIADKRSERAHLAALRENLEIARKRKLIAANRDDVLFAVESVSCAESPLLEKLCILRVYQMMNAKRDKLTRIANDVDCEKRDYINNSASESFKEFISKYKSDMTAQLLYENDMRYYYSGLNEFVDMSDGLPRALLTILKHIFDWSAFRGERPFQSGLISLSSQLDGVKQASETFLKEMLSVDEHVTSLRLAVDRLSELFRLHRFADKPIESSLTTFSVNEGLLDAQTEQLLALAKNCSLFLSVAGGQKERNSRSVSSKYQLNFMLSPRYNLPIVRRGAVAFKPEEVAALFVGTEESFAQIRSKWNERINAPQFLKSKGVADPLDQKSLFE